MESAQFKNKGGESCQKVEGANSASHIITHVLDRVMAHIAKSPKASNYFWAIAKDK